VPPAESFGGFQHLVSPVPGIDSSFYPRHDSTSLSKKLLSRSGVPRPEIVLILFKPSYL
jgi:hypothetical protein